VGTGWFIILS